MEEYTIEECENETSFIKDFLDGNDNEKVEYLMSCGEAYLNQGLTLSKDYYGECIDKYNEFITFCAMLLKEIKVEDNNTILLCMLLRELLFKGYFSVKKKFGASSSGYFDVFHYLGMDVVSGKGICRHVAYFYQDVFKELGLQGDVFHCIIDSDKELDFKKALTLRSNHILNTISYNDTVYGYNCLTDSVLRFTSAFRMLEIAPRYTERDILSAYYKFSTELMFGLSREEIVERMKSFLDSSKKGSIDFNYCVMCYCLVEELVYKNRHLLKDFRKETKPLKRKLVKEMEVAHAKFVRDGHKN